LGEAKRNKTLRGTLTGGQKKRGRTNKKTPNEVRGLFGSLKKRKGAKKLE